MFLQLKVKCMYISASQKEMSVSNKQGSIC